MWFPQGICFYAVGILACFGKRVFWVFQGMSTVRDSDIVNIKGKFSAFSEMQDTLVRPPPIFPQVCLILIIPNDPPATFKTFRSWHPNIRQDFRKATNI